MRDGSIILFDGQCNLCNASVQFLIRRDKKKKLRFAALQSEAGLALAREFQLLPPSSPESFVLIENGKAYTSSDAALRLNHYLPWHWQWTNIFWIVPKFIREAVYRLVAKNRYRWFGKRQECMIPTPGLRGRFLD